jgi:hypothetical protein
MTSRYRHRRTFDPAIAFPSPVEPGEIIVNTSNRQIAVGDASAGQLGVPKALIGVRFFDTTARYAANDVVVQAGNLYKANATIPPGAFNGANWTQLGVVTTMPAGSVVFTPTGNVIAIDVQGAIAELDAEKVAKAGDTMAGHLSLPTSPNAANAVRKDYVDAADAALATLAGGKVDKGGDTMSGALTLPADPTIALHAATKQYVDTNTGSALVVSDTPPAGAKDGSLWWESDSGLLYVRYNDGNTIQWVIAAPQPDINAFATHAYVDAGDLNALKYSAQSLTAAQAQQARQNIYAAPFDAMAYSGLQVNGSMEISQERGTGITSAIGSYICDGWKFFYSGTMVVNGAIASAAGWFAGFPSLLYMNLGVAQTTIGAADYTLLQQFIEGYRVARLQWGTANAQPITLCFWSAHHRPGLYSGVVRNGANNRTYAFTYTQAAADVPQYNVITVPGDTAGTWATDNTVGLVLTFALACGSTNTAPSANAWLAGSYAAAPGQMNAVAATSDVFRITGVIVLPGNEAPVQTKSPFVMRAYQDELLICKRYFYNGILPLKGVTGGAQPWAQRMGFPHPVAMRASPTVIIPATISFLDGSQILQSAGVTTNYSTPLALEVDCNTNVVGVAGRAMVVSIGGSTGNITADARL